MTHIVAGYPNMEECEEVAMAMARGGVSYLEIQIPFSDPVADGPVIMAANQAALDSGVKVEDCFELMKRLRAKFDEEGLDVELLFMSYFNILHKYGLQEFCQRTADLGGYGLIVPDMPIDEEASEGYLAVCNEAGLAAVQVVSPITPDERLERIGEAAEGLVYLVSRYGTTGVSSELNPELQGYIERVRKFVKVPLAVGFGISKAEHVRAVLEHADIAVMGSHFVRLVDEFGSGRVEEEVKNLLG